MELLPAARRHPAVPRRAGRDLFRMARILHVDAHSSFGRRRASIYLRPGDVHELYADKRGISANNCIFSDTRHFVSAM